MATETSLEIERAVREHIEALTDRMMIDALGVTTTTVADPAPTLTPGRLKDMMRGWASMVREARRHDVTIVVELGYDGPMCQHQHPTEGTYVECSHRQAQAIHEQWPLVLLKVESEHRALFRPATRFESYVLSVLPAPPYDPPEETADAETR